MLATQADAVMAMCSIPCCWAHYPPCWAIKYTPELRLICLTVEEEPCWFALHLSWSNPWGSNRCSNVVFPRSQRVARATGWNKSGLGTFSQLGPWPRFPHTLCCGTRAWKVQSVGCWPASIVGVPLHPSVSVCGQSLWHGVNCYTSLWCSWPTNWDFQSHVWDLKV